MDQELDPKPALDVPWRSLSRRQPLLCALYTQTRWSQIRGPASLERPRVVETLVQGSDRTDV